MSLLFSAPGRTELGGNHTDHQHGRVLAASVNLESTARVTQVGGEVIRVHSQGYAPVEMAIHDLRPHEDERETTAALVRGVAAAFAQRGYTLRGLTMEVHSNVLPGSGLSSSASFEVLVAAAFNHLFAGGALSRQELAKIGQQAENEYFGKPSGLMDQMACAVGGMVAIDFCDPEAPVVERLDFDFSQAGHALCILDSGASHAGLTNAYADIPGEMGAVADYFGCQVLRQVDEAAFYSALPRLRETVGDRAILRAMHFFDENRRADWEAEALRRGDFDRFLALMNESGESSWVYLQNVSLPNAAAHQEMALTLALCRRLLAGRGACRVHGGGFAGTVQALVPLDILPKFQAGMEALLGPGACHVLTISPDGARFVGEA